MRSGRSSGWTVSVPSQVRKALKRLPRDIAAKLLESAEALERDLLPLGVEKIHGLADTYRIWFGSYRIVYTLDHPRRAILVLRIAHRKDVYRNL